MLALVTAPLVPGKFSSFSAVFVANLNRCQFRLQASFAGRARLVTYHPFSRAVAKIFQAKFFLLFALMTILAAPRVILLQSFKIWASLYALFIFIVNPAAYTESAAQHPAGPFSGPHTVLWVSNAKFVKVWHEFV